MPPQAFLPLPTLPSPLSSPTHNPPLCTRSPQAKPKPARRRRPPPPPAPPLPSHLATQIKRGSGPEATALRRALQSRKDVYLTGSGLRGKISAILSARERDEHALLLFPTAQEARLAAREAKMDARGCTVMMVGNIGAEGERWRFAAQNANMSVKAAIVIGSVGGIWRMFCDGKQSAAGRVWLGKVRFLVVVDVARVFRFGGGKAFWTVLGCLKGKQGRKNILVDLKGDGDGDVGMEEDVREKVLREKAVVVHWAVAADSIARKGEREVLEEIGQKVSAEVVVCRDAVCVYHMLMKEVRAVLRDRGRMVVFFGTRRLAEWYALIARADGIEVAEVVRGTGVAIREERTEKFWQMGGVLFASDCVGFDVGMPRVGTVLQVGLPDRRETFGRRMGLLGKGGRGMVYVCEGEERGVGMFVGEGVGVGRGLDVGGTVGKVEDGKAAEKAYLSWLGYYGRLANRIGWHRGRLVEEGNQWALGLIGFVPKISRKNRNRLMLKGIPGVQVKPSPLTGI